MAHEVWTYPTNFGTFTTTQVFDYYDRPLTFLATDAVGTFYFGYLLAEDEAYSDTILFTPMSETRMNDLVRGKVSIRKALVDSENGWGIECFYPSRFSEKPMQTVLRKSCDLTDDEVPDEEIYLER